MRGFTHNPGRLNSCFLGRKTRMKSLKRGFPTTRVVAFSCFLEQKTRNKPLKRGLPTTRVVAFSCFLEQKTRNKPLKRGLPTTRVVAFSCFLEQKTRNKPLINLSPVAFRLAITTWNDLPEKLTGEAVSSPITMDPAHSDLVNLNFAHLPRFELNPFKKGIVFLLPHFR